MVASEQHSVEIIATPYHQNVTEGTELQITHDLTAEMLQLTDQPITPPLVRSLQEKHGDDLASAMLSSASLQSKACEKLGTGPWWVTDRALQQSTPWQVAKLKSNWFDSGLVADLCCGIGGDAKWIAARGETSAIDLDPIIAAMAAANLSDTNASVSCGDATMRELPQDSIIHIDPDRREDGQRRSAAEHCTPPWEFVVETINRTRGGIVKLAPAAEIDCEGLPPTHRTWISLKGSVREQSLLFGDVASRFANQAADRSAIMLDRAGKACRYLPSVATEPKAEIETKPAAMMVDPDAAIRASGLTDCFAREHGLSVLGLPSGFLTGSADANTDHRHAICEEVMWTGSPDDRKLRRELRARDAYPVRIKVRGASFDPAAMQKKYRSCGDTPVTLWVGRVGKRHYAAITKNESFVRD